MLLDDLKVLIKDFENVLLKDPRFKNDMFFKNQVKIIYDCEKRKINNVFVPMPIDNKDQLNEINKLKQKIVSLENSCKCGSYEKGELPDTDKLTSDYRDVADRSRETATSEDDLRTLFSLESFKKATTDKKLDIVRVLDSEYNRFSNFTNNELKKKLENWKQ